MPTFPKYESYKDSGVEWIGKIPSHWSLKSIRSVTDFKSERNRPDLPILSVYREYGVLLKDSRDDNHNATSLDISNYKVVEVGDLVVNKMKAWQGSMGISEHQGIVSPAYITCRVDASKISPKFLHYLLRSKPYIGVYNALSYGVRIGQWDMHYEDFKKISLPIPDIEEQRRIAEFLDRTTTDIDRAIAQKQRLIELLQEQKTILINQAVTKGLNPNVPMRDSGIAWLREIPKHWKVCALSYVAHLTAGGTPDRSKSQYWNGSIPWLKTGEINYNQITTSEEFITDQGLRNSSAKLASPGTILMAMYGQGVTRGRVAILGIEAAFNQACLAITPYSCLQTKYLYYYLQSAYSFVRDFGNETSQMNLSSGSIGKIRILIPSHEEQCLVSQFLDQKMVEFNKGISKQEEMIDSLMLLKQIFIAEAVTGKIKV